MAEENKLKIPPQYDLNAKWDACLDLGVRRFVYSSLAGAFTGLLLFREFFPLFFFIHFLVSFNLCFVFVFVILYYIIFCLRKYWDFINILMGNENLE